MMQRKKRGFVIEMMLIFMLITFGFCLLITTVVIGLRNERKFAHVNIQMQADLNQIGEYYLRYIELSGSLFPSGEEKEVEDFVHTSAKKNFDWMGTDEYGADGAPINHVKEFFARKSGDYTYQTFYSIKRGGVGSFFSTKAIWRKLVVTSKRDGQIKMVVEVTETRASETSSTKANYTIQSWSIGDSLIDETEDDYKEEDFGVLQILWKLVGQYMESFRHSFQGLQYQSIEELFTANYEAFISLLELFFNIDL